jgi:hypothetical protein
MALDARWKNFELALGKDSGLLELATKGLVALAEAVEAVTGFAERFPGLTNAILLVVTALIGLKVAMLLTGYGATFAKDAVIYTSAALTALSPSVMSARLAMAKAYLSSKLLAVQQFALAAGSRIAAAGIWLWNAALAANPIALVVIAVAALAIAVYKYWGPIKAFVGGLWDGLAVGLEPLAPLFGKIGAFISGVADKAKVLIDYFAPGAAHIVQWFSELFSPIAATKAQLDSAANAGRSFGSSIANAVKSAIALFSGLHEKFVGYGANIMAGLSLGISNGYAAVKAKIAAVAQTVKDAFKGALGIHSPSRVFAGYGVNITQGLGVGLQDQKSALAASANLARSVALAFEGASGAGSASYARDYFAKNGWLSALPSLDWAALAGLDADAKAVSRPGVSQNPSYPHAGGVTYHQTITIEVHGSEGMSAQQLAKLVEKRFVERTSTHGQMFDGAY